MPTRLIDQRATRRLGSKASAISIDESATQAGASLGKRLLRLDGEAAFELSFWCGTCPFLFRRLEGANRTLSIEDLEAQLNAGLGSVDETMVDAIAALLPDGVYVPLLIEIHPRLVFPGDAGDYFEHEQVATWGIDPFWGLPESPRTPYYRTPTRAIDHETRLFEFVVPMVPTSWNDRARVAQHGERLRHGPEPTCVALGVLDVRQQAVWHTPDGGLIHWGLAHYLLDGHHKIEAAASARLPVRVLSLVSVTASLADDDDVGRLAEILAVAPLAQPVDGRP